MSLMSPKIRDESGYTLLETIAVIVITAIMASMFGQILATTAAMYADSNLRKNAHIDARRGMEMIMQDVREWNAWQNAPTATTLDLLQADDFQRTWFFFTYTYYDFFHVGYNLTSGKLTYQRDDGTWANQYNVITGGLVTGQAAFTNTTAGGTTRIGIDFRMMINKGALRLRTTVFPRKQGG